MFNSLAGNRRLLDYAQLLLAMVLWGSLFPASKPVLAVVPARDVALVRAACAFLVLGGLVLFRGKARDALSELARRPWSSWVLGLFSFFLSSMLSLMALEYLPASVAAFIVNANPLWLSLAAVASRRVRRPARVVFGATLALVGVGLVLFRDAQVTSLPVAGIDYRGVVLAVACSVVIAAQTAWAGRAVRGCDAIVVTGLASGWGLMMLLPVVLSGGGIGPLLASPPDTKLLLLYIGLGCTAATFPLYNDVLRRLPAERVGVFQYLIPLFGAILAFTFLGEPATVPLLAGGLTILFGIALTQGWEEQSAAGRQAVHFRGKSTSGEESRPGRAGDA